MPAKNPGLSLGLNLPRPERIELAMQTKPDLDNLLLAFPCPIKWESMDGDERERLCKQCSQKVYNISDMTKDEAEAFLAENVERDDACLFFYQRSDGTIKTDNCPRYLRPLRDFAFWVNKSVSLGAALIVSCAVSACSGRSVQPVVAGDTYQTTDFECTGWAGRPAPNEIRENTYNVVFDARKFAPKNLSEKFEQEEKKHLINILTLNSLSEIYRLKKLNIQLFHVRLLTELVKRKMPGQRQAFDSLDFEKLRQQVLVEELDKVAKLLEEGNSEGAAFHCQNFLNVAIAGASLTRSWVKLPNDVKEWKTIDQKSLFASEDNLNKALVLFHRVDEEICGMNDLILQLEGAKKLTLADASELKSIRGQLLKDREDLKVINNEVMRLGREPYRTENGDIAEMGFGKKTVAILTREMAKFEKNRAILRDGMIITLIE